MAAPAEKPERARAKPGKRQYATVAAAAGIALASAAAVGLLSRSGHWEAAAFAGLLGVAMAAFLVHRMAVSASGGKDQSQDRTGLLRDALEHERIGVAIAAPDGSPLFVSNGLRAAQDEFSESVPSGLAAFLGGGPEFETRIAALTDKASVGETASGRFSRRSRSGRRETDRATPAEDDLPSHLYVTAVRLEGDALCWSVAEETTDQKAADELRARLSVLSKAVEQAPFGVVSLDPSGVIVEANQIFRDLSDAPHVHGRAILDVVAEDDRPALRERLEEARQSDLPAAPPLDIRLASADGDGAVVTVYVGRAGGGRGRSADDLLLHVVDATERRRLETQFAQSQKMQAVGQLAGGIAHDFNNMLTAMIGFCDLLLQRHQPGEASFGDAMQIKHNANRAAGLVRQLLAFSREQSLDARPLDMTELLAELSQLLRRLLGESVELSVVHGRDLWPVRADPGKIEQMIINLAVNARDAMPKGGRLTIQTDNFTARKSYELRGETLSPGEYVSIAVSDTGEGMSEGTLEHLFEPFFTTKEVGDGTGLGLAMVYGSVKQMGGCVFAHSDGADKGARISLYLPRSMEAVHPVASQADDESALGDVTGVGQVLLVEDEDGVRLFSARALRSKGYQVTEARTGEAALEILEQQRFDLLLTDMVMPKVDGATLIRRAREKSPDLPVVCISGYTRESMAREIDGLENLRFLSKPFSLKQLAATVKLALESNGEGGSPKA